MTTIASPPGLREDYEATFVSLAELEQKYGLSRPEIAKFRRAEGWVPRPSSPDALAAYRLANAVRKLGAPETKARRKSSEPRAASAIDTACEPACSEGLAPPLIKGKPKQSSGGTRHRRSLKQRLYDLFDAKLAEIETRIATRTKLSRTEIESELRQFGALIKNFESLNDLSDAELKQHSTTSTADGLTADDAERLRLDLVERLEKLRDAPADSGASG